MNMKQRAIQAYKACRDREFENAMHRSKESLAMEVAKGKVSRQAKYIWEEAGIDPKEYTVVVGEGGAQNEKVRKAKNTIIRIYESDLR